MINCFYIFSRRGSCLYYKEWHRPKNPLADAPGEDPKLMFGLLLSLKVLMQKMDPTTDKNAPTTGPDQGIFRYTCSGYSLHYLESSTGYRFVLVTDPQAPDMRQVLWHIYSELFVTYVLKNPLYTPGTTIEAAAFMNELDSYLKTSGPA
jgi:trafficking protein particle complex subunit 1